MNEVLMTSALMTMFYAVMAVAVTWGMLRLLDVAGGLYSKKIIWRIGDDPRSACIYFGLRFLGACILVGLAIS